MARLPSSKNTNRPNKVVVAEKVSDKSSDAATVVLDDIDKLSDAELRKLAVIGKKYKERSKASSKKRYEENKKSLSLKRQIRTQKKKLVSSSAKLEILEKELADVVAMALGGRGVDGAVVVPAGVVAMDTAAAGNGEGAEIDDEENARLLDSLA